MLFKITQSQEAENVKKVDCNDNRLLFLGYLSPPKSWPTYFFPWLFIILGLTD